jgi:DNA-binding MarR family transcriptional regulator
MQTTSIITDSEDAIILNCIRSLVQALRLHSSASEKESGLSSAQLFVLDKLKSNWPLTMNELAALTFTHQSSVSVVVQKLLKKGLIKKSTNQNDLRSSVVALSAKGRSFMKNRSSCFHDQIMKAISELPDHDRLHFARIFRSLLLKSGFLSIHPPLLQEDGIQKSKKPPRTAVTKRPIKKAASK